MTSPKVTQLWRYPVKSMAGEKRQSAFLGPKGIPGDRAWVVRDETLGGIRGGKRFPQLMGCAARYIDEPALEGSSPAEVILPGGETLGTGDKALPDKLTQVIGSPVTFWPLMPESQRDHYKRGAPVLADRQAEFRRLFGRTEDEPMPDVSKFPPELAELESPLGTYFDAFPLLLMTEQSLAHIKNAAPDSQIDVRRFRPNIMLDCAGAEGLVERAWEGQTAKLGTATLKLELNCPRCVMTTHGFDDLPKDPKIMRSLVKEASGELGIYASVLEPGEVKLGDELVLGS